ncbi:MAG: zf-HC2 domain-containing protein [Acidobacteriaceae bacterium]
MNHNDALRLSAAERYLLRDLDEDLRDQFEAHFFECTDCANDVQSGAAMLDQMKIELAREAKKLFFLRPAWGAAIAAMLLVIGYQNLVEVPRLKTELTSLNSPGVLPTVSLVGGVSRADKLPSAEVKPYKPVLLKVDIPTDDRYSSYEVSVLDSGGKPAWTMPISARQAKDTLSIEMPAKELQAGTYTLVIEGLASGAKPIAVERRLFQIYSHN